MKILKILLLLCLIMLSTSACASNQYWLTSSPYLVGYSVLPSTFVINVGRGSTDITVPAFQSVGGTAVILWYDVSNEKETFLVRAKACADTVCSPWSTWKLVSKSPRKPKLHITNSDEIPEESILNYIEAE